MTSAAAAALAVLLALPVPLAAGGAATPSAGEVGVPTASCPDLPSGEPRPAPVVAGPDDERYPGAEVPPPGAVIDATATGWKVPRGEGSTWTVPIVLGGLDRDDLCLVGGDVRLDLPYATSRYEEWHGDRDGGVPTADNVSGVPNETGGLDVSEARVALVGTTIANVGDGVSFARNRTPAGDVVEPGGWLLDGVRMADVHDDCVENDALVSGRVVDSLFDGCFVFYSATTGGSGSVAGPDASGETVEIRDSLVHLATMPDGSASPGNGRSPGPLAPAHGVMWKLGTIPAQGHAPRLEVSGSTFLIDGSLDTTKVSYRFPAHCTDPSGCEQGEAAPYAPDDCDRPNTVIWAGADSLADDPAADGDLADQFATWGPCFEVVDADDLVPGRAHTWREEWGNRRRAWLADHTAGGAVTSLAAPVPVDVGGPLVAGEVRTVELDDVEGLPPNVSVGTVALRVTVRDPAQATAVTVWGEGTRPEGSAVRAAAGRSAGATTVVAPGRIDRGPFEVPSDGSSIRITSDVDAAVEVEVLGWSAASPATPDQAAGSQVALAPAAPTRLADSAVPGRGWEPGGPIGAVAWRTLDLSGVVPSDALPSDAVAVVVDVEASGVRRVEISPAGSAAGARVWRGADGSPTGGLAIVPLGPDRRLRLAVLGPGRVSVDLLAVVRPLR